MSSCRRGRHREPQQGDSSTSDSDRERNERCNRNQGAKRVTYLDACKKRIQCAASQMTGKSCTCLFFYFLKFCLVLAFLYLFSLTFLENILGFLHVLAQLFLPASWLQSTRDIVQEALAKYSADRLGLADYALESAGGSVLCNSETYFAKSGAMYSVFGIPLWYHTSSPREVIQPDVQPGKCWAMDGTEGYVMIKLAMPIIVNAISLEHIPKEVAASGRLDSAPRDFMIIGKERSMDSPDVVLGKFTYRIGREPIQVFDIKDPYCLNKSDGDTCGPNNKVFNILTLKILNNHGNPDFTCIYRLRVHGDPLITVPTY